jgi:hypothetical protein
MRWVRRTDRAGVLVVVMSKQTPQLDPSGI